MQKRIFLLALFIFSIFSGGIFAQEDYIFEEDESRPLESVERKEDGNGADESLTVAAFNIEGLKRTKRSYMDGLLSEFLNKPASGATLHAIETKLQAQNLFDQIKVSARPLSQNQAGQKQASVDISFKEKWSILPLPFGYYTDGAYAVGLFVMDMNAFGRGCMATAGGIYSPSNLMGAAMFRKPALQKGTLGFYVAANAQKATHGYVNSKNRWVFGYENFYTASRAALLFKPTNNTSANVGASYSFFNPIDSPRVDRMNQWSVNASWGISCSEWNGYFLCVNSLSVGTELFFSDNSKQYFAQAFTFNAQVQRPLFGRMRLVTAARGFFSNDLYVANYSGRSSSGLTLLPKNFASPQVFGFFSGFELAVLKIKYGMLSVYAFYGVAAARDWDKSFYACHGPEAGVRIYFAKLAFPAFSFGASYNINENVFRYSFSGGVSF